MTTGTDALSSSALPRGLRPLVVTFGLYNFGWGVLLLVFSYGAYSAAGSALDVALLGACLAAPVLILLPLSSRIVHRFPPRPLNVVMLILDASLFFSLGVYAAIFGDSLTLLFVAAALTGVLLVAIGVPAWRNLIRVAVPTNQLSDLNSSLLSAKSAGQVAGVLTGGLLYETLGDAGLFMICATLVLPLLWSTARLPTNGAINKPEVSQRASIKVAMREVWLSKIMRSVFILMAGLIFAAWPLMVLLPPLASYIFPSSQVALSFLMAMFYAGAALMETAVRWRLGVLHGDHPRAVVRASAGSWTRTLLLLSGVLVALLALTAHFEPALLALAVTGLLLVPIGLLMGLLGVMTQTLVQREVSPSSAATALTAYVIVVEIGTSIGSLVTSALSDAISVFAILIGLGVLSVLITFWLVRAKRFISVSEMVGDAFVPVGVEEAATAATAQQTARQ